MLKQALSKSKKSYQNLVKINSQTFKTTEIPKLNISKNINSPLTSISKSARSKTSHKDTNSNNEMLKLMRHRLIKNLEERDEQSARSQEIINYKPIQKCETERVKINNKVSKPFMSFTKSKKQYIMDSADFLKTKLQKSSKLDNSNSSKTQIKDDIIKRNRNIKVVPKKQIFQISAEDEMKYLKKSTTNFLIKFFRQE